MDGLTESFARCPSTRHEEEEEEEIAVDEDPTPMARVEGVRNLIGRVVSPKILSSVAIKMHLTRLIQPVLGFKLQDLGPNKFALSFKNPRDCGLDMEGSPWLVDRCAVLLEALEEGTDPKTVEVNTMTIVVRLHFIPMHLCSGKVVEQLGSSLGELVEKVNGKRDAFVEYVRVRVRMDVRKPLKRGSFLRKGDGSRKWVAFSYELMPLYCFLCGIVGHMEKRCPTRYQQGFVDPGKDFQFGEWMKATSKGEGDRGIPLPLQPVSTLTNRVPSKTVRGTNAFDVGRAELVNVPIGQENTSPGIIRGQISKPKSSSLDSSNSSEIRKRNVVTTSGSRNRKNKEVAKGYECSDRPFKKLQICDALESTQLSVAAAAHPHRLQ